MDADGWAVTSTQPHREMVALENLLRQNFRAYCPRITKRVRHARRSRDLLRPLFPGYLFVRVQTGRWRPILSTLGVRSLVRFGDRPSLVSDGFIEALQAREVDGGLEGEERPFQVGQEVRLAGGVFDGLVATIVGLGEKDRLLVLMDLLMRTVRVSVAERDVVAL